MSRYFRIYGLREGMPIRPFLIETDGALPYCVTLETNHKDESLDYEELTKAQFDAITKQEKEIN